MAEHIPTEFLERSAGQPVLKITTDREVGGTCHVQCITGIGIDKPEIKETEGGPALTTKAGCVLTSLSGQERDGAMTSFKFEGLLGVERFPDKDGIVVITPSLICPSGPASVTRTDINDATQPLVNEGRHTRTFAGYTDISLVLENLTMCVLEDNMYLQAAALVITTAARQGMKAAYKMAIGI